MGRDRSLDRSRPAPPDLAVLDQAKRAQAAPLACRENEVIVKNQAELGGELPKFSGGCDVLGARRGIAARVAMTENHSCGAEPDRVRYDDTDRDHDMICGEAQLALEPQQSLHFINEGDEQNLALAAPEFSFEQVGGVACGPELKPLRFG